jgi:hypothetical protein
MTYQINSDTNVDELTAQEIETLKVRVQCLSQELWTCQEYPDRINVLIMLSAAVSELLLLETNQQARYVKSKQ